MRFCIYPAGVICPIGYACILWFFKPSLTPAGFFFIPGGSMRTAKELMWLAFFDYAIMAAIAIGVIKLVLSYR